MSANPVKAPELAKMPAFKHMEAAQLETLASEMVRRTYAPGQIIFLEGDLSIGLWFIIQGHVKIIKQSQSGRLQGLCLVNRGKCFGGCPLFDTSTNPANAQSLDEVTLAILPREALQRLIYNDSHLATNLLQIYTNRAGLLARLGESLGVWPVATRINDCLVAYSTGHSQLYALVELTHEEIATLVGTAREVVTRHLSKLEDDAVIETSPGRILLKDLDALKSSCLGGRHPS